MVKVQGYIYIKNNKIKGNAKRNGKRKR